MSLFVSLLPYRQLFYQSSSHWQSLLEMQQIFTFPLNNHHRFLLAIHHVGFLGTWNVKLLRLHRHYGERTVDVLKNLNLESAQRGVQDSELL